jgi:DNA-binding response OmpR family regulator
VIYLNRCNKLLLEKSNLSKKGIQLLDESISDKRILIVDDNRAILDLTSRMFVKKQFEVITAETMKNAILKYENFQPEFILTDLNLLDGDGYLLIQSIRKIANRYDKYPIIVLMTSDDSEELQIKSKEAGANFNVKKPIQFDDLIEKMVSLV